MGVKFDIIEETTKGVASEVMADLCLPSVTKKADTTVNHEIGYIKFKINCPYCKKTIDGKIEGDF